MQGVTGVVAILASCVIIMARPVWGLAAYAAVLIWYPARLTIKLGTADLSAARIVILVLLCKLLLSPSDGRNRFRLIPMDWWVFAFFGAQIISGFFTAVDVMDFLENRFGAVFDLMLPYFAVRLSIPDRTAYVRFVKALMMLAIPYAFVGLFQSLTGRNLYTPLLQHSAWGGTGERVDMRLGLYRAYACMPVHILYGVFFCQATTLATSIYHHFKKSPMLWWLGIGALGMGIFTSLSSGPFLAAFLFVCFLGLYKIRRYWRVIVTMAVVMCLLLEVMSNRHFYDVIDRFVISSATAWYRSRLFEVALFEGGMTDHWILGYGYNVDPGWSQKIDLRDHTDIVNHYLLVLARSGLLALVPFFGILTAAFQSMHQAFRRAWNVADRWLVWSLFAGLASLMVVFFTVSLFGQPQTIFYMLLALCGISPALMTRGKRPVPVKKQAVHSGPPLERE